MKKKWRDYLKAIGFKKPYIDQASKVLEFYEEILADEIDDIFVEDFVDEAGERHYESMWVLTSNSLHEARDFLTKVDEDFDCVPGSDIIYWRLRKKDYDFQKATEQSRMSIDLIFADDVSGSMKASKENCDYLRNIFIKYVAKSAKDTET